MTAPTTRERHRALAHAFSRYHEERPDLLFVHHAGAGEDELASMHGERAAHRAHEALAFDRASSLFLEAAKLTKDVVRRQRLTEHGGDSLIAGGRTKAAAMVFDELAVGAAGDALARVQRKAAEAYLVTGHQPEGLRIWRRAALGMGLGFPKTPLGAAVGAVLALFRARFPSLHRLVKRTTPAEATARAEAALAAAKGLIATDPMHGVLFGAESLAHARVAGTADALVTSLSFVAAACLAAAGGISRQWAVALLEEADGLSGPEHGPHLPAIVTIARAQIALFQGRWAEAAERAQSGLATLAGTGRVRAWEASMARVARVRALEELGEFGRLVRETEEWLARAGETGDVFGVVTSHLTLGIGSLATATPEAAESHANTADGIWRGTGYSVQRFYADRIRVLSTLQRGDLDEAVRRLGTVSRAVRASMIFRIPTGRIDALWMEARVALGCLQGKDGRVGALRALARSLEREDHVPARAHAAFIRARLASSLGEPDEPHLLAARERYAEAGMVPMSLLVEGCRQPSAVAAALDRLAELGVADPVAWCRGHGVDVQAQIPRVSEAAR